MRPRCAVALFVLALSSCAAPPPPAPLPDAPRLRAPWPTGAKPHPPADFILTYWPARGVRTMVRVQWIDESAAVEILTFPVAAGCNQKASTSFQIADAAQLHALADGLFPPDLPEADPCDHSARDGISWSMRRRVDGVVLARHRQDGAKSSECKAFEATAEAFFTSVGLVADHSGYRLLEDPKSGQACR